MNSFVSINCVPLDVLSLIPTHLSSQKDRFRATFVCRHWRRTFIQNAGLWSYLKLSKGEVYVRTLLERAKGSPLSILASGFDPVGVLMLLPPHAKKIAELEFTNNRWADVQRFSETIFGPLPLLRTLNISASEWNSQGNHRIVTSPSLFGGAVGLKELRLHVQLSPFLSHFAFPTLTCFEFSVASAGGFRGSELLDFLEALPMLQTVYMKIVAPIPLEGIPQERIVVLRNVESLSLVARGGDRGYKFASHLSCPSIKHTSLTHMGKYEIDHDVPPEAFPKSDLWNTILRRYTRSPIEEVALETTTDSDYFITCSLTFRSTDTTVLKLPFEIPQIDVDVDPDTPEWKDSFAEVYSVVFAEVSRTIQDLPLLENVERLHVYGLLDLGEGWNPPFANEFRRLLLSLNHLEELTLCRSDIRPYLYPLVNYPKILGRNVQVAYTPIRVLTISDPPDTFTKEVGADLVELVKSQHNLGMPFERVSVRKYYPPPGMKERLEPWIWVVDTSVPTGGYRGPVRSGVFVRTYTYTYR